MTVMELAQLTWEETRDLARHHPVAVLPVGAIEAHGPHLPLGTDVIIAEQMARAGAERLAARGRTVILLPALPFTAAPFAARFPGTVSLDPHTTQAVVVDLARELTRHGFAALALANAHLDPAHIAALEGAKTRCREGHLLPVVCPDVARRPWAARLSAEFQSGACHAGRYEGSIVMAARPDLVREDIRTTLPPNPVSLSRAIRDGRHTFEEAGGSRAYFGAPAEATASEGAATIATLGDILAEAVWAELEPESAA